MTNGRKKLLEHLTLRLDEELVARLEEHARRVEELAGVRVSRSEIARQVLVRGLDALELDREPSRARA